MNDYTVVIKVEICECEDKQEAINFVADNIGLSEFKVLYNLIKDAIDKEDINEIKKLLNNPFIGYKEKSNQNNL